MVVLTDTNGDAVLIYVTKTNAFKLTSLLDPFKVDEDHDGMTCELYKTASYPTVLGMTCKPHEGTLSSTIIRGTHFAALTRVLKATGIRVGCIRVTDQ